MTQNKKTLHKILHTINYIINKHEWWIPAQLNTVLLTKLLDDFYLNLSEFLRRNNIVYNENWFSLTFFYGYPLYFDVETYF